LAVLAPDMMHIMCESAACLSEVWQNRTKTLPSLCKTCSTDKWIDSFYYV